MLVFPENPNIWDSLDFLLFSESQTSAASDTYTLQFESHR